VEEIKGDIWIKGEWMLSGDNQRSRMEYKKSKDFSDETHGRMIITLKELIQKRDNDLFQLKNQKIEQQKATVEENKEQKHDEIEFKEPEKPKDINKCSSLAKESTEYEKVFMIQKDFSNKKSIPEHQLK
jgi:hypothetical protein